MHLTSIMERYVECKELLRDKPQSPFLASANKLISQVLILMINSPLMTKSVFESAVDCAKNETSLPKIVPIFEKLLQENPLWSIYDNPWLFNMLSEKSQALSLRNLELSTFKKNGLVNILSQIICPQDNNSIPVMISSYVGYPDDIDPEVDFAGPLALERGTPLKSLSQALSTEADLPPASEVSYAAAASAPFLDSEVSFAGELGLH